MQINNIFIIMRGDRERVVNKTVYWNILKMCLFGVERNHKYQIVNCHLLNVTCTSLHNLGKCHYSTKQNVFNTQIIGEQASYVHSTYGVRKK